MNQSSADFIRPGDLVRVISMIRAVNPNDNKIQRTITRRSVLVIISIFRYNDESFYYTSTTSEFIRYVIVHEGELFAVDFSSVEAALSFIERVR